jgi:hypothetical protein
MAVAAVRELAREVASREDSGGCARLLRMIDFRA